MRRKLTDEHKRKISLSLKHYNKLHKKGKTDPHYIARKLFGKKYCEQCGITNWLSLKVYGENLSMHYRLLSKDYSVMKSAVWKTFCKGCHIRFHLKLRYNLLSEPKIKKLNFRRVKIPFYKIKFLIMPSVILDLWEKWPIDRNHEIILLQWITVSLFNMDCENSLLKHHKVYKDTMRDYLSESLPKIRNKFISIQC